MQPSERQGPDESCLSVWRRAHRRLRALERKLVQDATLIESGLEFDLLFREIESLREDTTQLFVLAQVESVAGHVKSHQVGAYIEPTAHALADGLALPSRRTLQRHPAPGGSGAHA